MVRNAQLAQRLGRIDVEVLGFVFGSSGFTFALLAWMIASSASQRVNELESRLREAGVITEQNELEGEAT